jgi:hypothetical protein
VSVPIEESLRLLHAAGSECCLPSSIHPPSEKEKKMAQLAFHRWEGWIKKGRVEVVGERPDGKLVFRKIS